jgi:hypothetical protein
LFHTVPHAILQQLAREKKISSSGQKSNLKKPKKTKLIDIPVISSSVQEFCKQDPSASLNAALGQVQSVSTEEAQPATTAASDIHRSYRHEKAHGQFLIDMVYCLLKVERGDIQDKDWHHR